MAETYTPNKNLELIGTGDLSGSWGSALNSNVFTPIDNMLGGNLSLSVAGNSNVSLTATQAENCIHKYTGALTGNIEVIFPSGNAAGLFLISNQTSGNFTLTVVTAAGGSTGIVVPQGYGQYLYNDGTNFYAASPPITPTGTTPPLVSPSISGTVTGNATYDGITLSGATSEGTLTNSGTISGGTVSGATLSGTTTLADGGSSASGGTVLGTATGGAKGSGTLNAQGLYLNGVSILPIMGQCRLSVVSTTSLELAPYKGCLIQIAGQIYAIPSGGVSISNAGLSASTLYYAYLYSNAGTLTLELSTTTHTTDTTAGNVGVEIKSGDNSRTLVGMVYTNGSSQFVDSASNRNVANWFNRQSRSFLGSSTGGSVTTSTTFVELSTNARVGGVVWADDVPMICIEGFVENGVSGDICDVNFERDGASAVLPVNISVTCPIQNEPFLAASSGVDTGASEGHHYWTPVGAVVSGSGAFTVALTGDIR